MSAAFSTLPLASNIDAIQALCDFCEVTVQSARILTLEEKAKINQRSTLLTMPSAMVSGGM